MAVRRRISQEKRKRQKNTRNIFMVIDLVLAIIILLILVLPGGTGFIKNIKRTLMGTFGYLSFFFPLFLFQIAAWLGLKVKHTGFKVLTGLLVTGYFFAALLDMGISRLNLGFHNIPGGILVGALVERSSVAMGPPIAFIVIFALFFISLIIFTGWDLSRDFNSISQWFAGAGSWIAGLIKAAVEKRRGRVRSNKSRKRPGSDENPWEDKRSKKPVRELPFTKNNELIEGRDEQGGLRDDESRSSEEHGRVSPTDPVETRKRHRTVEKVTPECYGESSQKIVYELPSEDLLQLPPARLDKKVSEEMIRMQAELLVEKLADFDIDCKVVSTHPGPVITRFEVAPGPGVKISRFVALSDDLALALKAKRIRILAPIPGKGAVGIEIPNPDPEIVYLREILGAITDEILPVALGKRIDGEPFATDICRTPHLLIAGATGSGKSVGIHTIITSILMKKTPHEVRFAMIDPKMLELSTYKGIPHLWAPVVLEVDKAKLLLRALVREMEQRYQKLARMAVRSISEFNDKLTIETEEERIPYIVVVIDELADLMVMAANDIEPAITRLAQMARAVGIHLVLATQRPSVDVITGVIKANFPSRLAFNVKSKTDSRTILDMNGADKLLGNGDMMFMPAGLPEPYRIHGSFISTAETKAVVDFLKSQPELPFEYEFPVDDHGNLMDASEIEIDDPLYEKAKRLVIETQQGSVSLIQRRLKVGYSRAGRLVDMLEQTGVVGPFQGSKAREVLMAPDLRIDSDDN